MPKLAESKRWSTSLVVCLALGSAVIGYSLRSFYSRPSSGGQHPTSLSPLPSVPSPVVQPPETSNASSAVAAYEELASTRPRSEVQAQELALHLSRLAETDPEKALRAAMAQENGRVRELLRDAVLRTWAKQDPEKAAGWALHQPSSSDRLSAMYPVFEGVAAHDPAAAVHLAKTLYAETPHLAADYGSIAITMLAKQGAFREATEFALQTLNAGAQAGWTNLAFNAWAEYEPETASAAMAQIAALDLRREAFLGVVSGWATANPVGLANYAKSLPAGEDRSEAMRTSLLRWVDKDPVKASEWMNTVDPGPDVDQASAAVAVMPFLVANHPDTALSWALSITDPEARADTLRTLATQLSLSDLAAGRRLVGSPLFSAPSDREAFSSGLHAPPPFR